MPDSKISQLVEQTSVLPDDQLLIVRNDGGTLANYKVKKSNLAPDASSTTKGLVRLTADLGGTADSPTVPELADKANIADLATVATTGSYLDLVDTPTIEVTSVAGKTGDVILEKADVGLSLVDNTADSDKPISDPTQLALDTKENLSNKSTSTSLGTSNTLYPTQNAVKSYVDTNLTSGLSTKVDITASLPKVRATRTTNQSISNNTITTVIFNNEVLDSNNIYNPTTGETTISVGAEYQIEATFRMHANASDPGTVVVGAYIYVNGNLVVQPCTYIATNIQTFTWGFNFSEKVFLNTGDVVTVRVLGSNSGTSPSVILVPTTSQPLKLAITRVL